MKRIIATIAAVYISSINAEDIHGVWKSSLPKSMEFYQEHNKVDAKVQSFMQENFGHLWFSIGSNNEWRRCFEAYSYKPANSQSIRNNPELCWEGTYSVLAEDANYLILKIQENSPESTQDKKAAVKPQESWLLILGKVNGNTMYIYSNARHTVEYFEKK